MYLKQLTLVNTGPISRAALGFPTRPLAATSALIPNEPASVETPMPVVLVGENGAGKSICLSHIVNILMSIQQSAYPENPEVEKDKIYKIGSPGYIKMGAPFYYGRAVFADGQANEEIVLNAPKKNFESPPDEALKDSSAWKIMQPNSHFGFSGFAFERNPLGNKAQLLWCQNFFNNNCVLYFPPNRFEEPAWLNIENLKSKAHFLDLKNTEGSTDRTVIIYHPMQFNQNWMFGVIYDQFIYEKREIPLSVRFGDGHSENIQQVVNLPGRATLLRNAATKVVNAIMRRKGPFRFGVSGRESRRLDLVNEQDAKTGVQNLFQLSAGETALLNLFLSILRDFDMSGAEFKALDEIRGIVVVDEVDLHLHSVHQYEVLPALIKMFPRVQFILASHSPLFVLGMRRLFGDDGFVLYRLPEGRPISAEEFGEFENAYRAFTETRRFTDEIQNQIKNSQKPILIAEGKTDVAYLKRAAKLRNRPAVLEVVDDFIDGGGKDKLKAAWTFLSTSQPFEQEVVLLFDCDANVKNDRDGKVHKLLVPRREDAPVRDGIENRFDEKTLKKVPRDVIGDIPWVQKGIEGGETCKKQWLIDKGRKSALCDWLCEHGASDDFQHFDEIFDMLEKILGAEVAPPSAPPPDKANGAA